MDVQVQLIEEGRTVECVNVHSFLRYDLKDGEHGKVVDLFKVFGLPFDTRRLPLHFF